MMHALTAIEAYFTYMGMYWYREIAMFLQSDHLVRAVCLLVFGIMFMTTVAQLFARQMGSSLLPSYVNFGTLVKLVVCYLLGLAALKADTRSSVTDFTKKSYEDSPYIVSRLGHVDPDLRLSLLLDVMIRTAEEIGWAVSKLTDIAMKGPHSGTEAPNLYYKALMLAGATTIDDPKLREKLELYTVDCIAPLVPMVEGLNANQSIEGIVNFSDSYSQELAQIPVGTDSTCLDVRQEITNDLHKVALPNMEWTERLGALLTDRSNVPVNELMNYQISSALLNFYIDKNESGLGVMQGGEAKGIYGRILQYLGKLTSHEGIMRTMGLREAAGAGVAVERAKQFNEQLRLAPMILGLSKAGLIVFGAFLPFFIIAMKWRIVIWWWLVYLSLCLWVPLWTALYKLMTNIFVVPDVLTSMGKMTDSFSLYSAMLISDQAYYISSVISWAQVAVGPGLTGLVGFFAGQWLLSSREDHMPTAIQETKDVVLVGANLMK